MSYNEDGINDDLKIYHEKRGWGTIVVTPQAVAEARPEH